MRTMDRSRLLLAVQRAICCPAGCAVSAACRCAAYAEQAEAAVQAVGREWADALAVPDGQRDVLRRRAGEE